MKKNSHRLIRVAIFVGKIIISGILNPRFALNAVREYCLAVARTYRVAMELGVLFQLGCLQHDEGSNYPIDPV